MAEISTDSIAGRMADRVAAVVHVAEQEANAILREAELEVAARQAAAQRMIEEQARALHAVTSSAIGAASTLYEQLQRLAELREQMEQVIAASDPADPADPADPEVAAPEPPAEGDRAPLAVEAPLEAADGDGHRLDSLRLVALSMAASGRSATEVEAHLRDELGMSDPTVIIDYVFGLSTPASVVPGWPPPATGAA